MPEPTPIPLAYESAVEPSTPHHRPKWVYFVVGFYALLILGSVLAIIIPTALADDRNFLITLSITLAILLGCEVGLLMVPVRVGSRRPLARKSIWIPLVASGLLAGLLVLSAGMALWELFENAGTENIGWLIIGTSLAVWFAWTVIFWRMSATRDPTSLTSRLHRYLLSGSVLELLIAVPSHVIVRRRTECCAGLMTCFAICAGIAVMLLAFGPSVAFLYYKRWKQISR